METNILAMVLDENKFYQATTKDVFVSKLDEVFEIVSFPVFLPSRVKVNTGSPDVAFDLI